MSVLKGEEEKGLFLSSLARYKKRFGFKLYGLVIMDNHFHLLLETNETNDISKVMQSFLLSFGNRYRKRHHYAGHLWESRFQSRLLVNEVYVLECLDYIHNNPVKAGVVAKPEDYPWSSFFFYSGSINNRISDYIALDRFGDTSTIT